MRKITVGSMFKIALIFMIIKQFYIKPVSINQLFLNFNTLKLFVYNVFIEFGAFVFLSLLLIIISGFFGNRLLK